LVEFDAAFDYTMQYEGGLVDNFHDHGKLTNFGISLTFLESMPGQYCADSDTARRTYIRLLTRDQAKVIYRENFWKEWVAKLTDQSVANYIFDCAVNSGFIQAVRFIQRACNTCGFSDLYVDGLMGTMTWNVLRTIESTILPHLERERLNYYQACCKANPKDTEFLRGWTKRAMGQPL